MTMSAHDLMAFSVLASMKAAERERARMPLIMTLLPGPPAQRAQIATVAVGTQAQDAVRRERRVAAAALSSLGALAAGEAPAVVLMNSPLLCDLDAEEILEDIRAMWAAYGTPRFGIELPREGELWDRP